ncbi:ABC transporter substrate-binding protein [Aerococcus kribbianus]|uniref:ABC transporter substrate-binding protein n=1 Tax=Aerococcus kribbianus TaxID=2999064 RepID=A0A9X3FP51_9LACT|nr:MULTISPECIES: ABC transporter substrate-binding protein [unclassified Aerococcus]MCZ0717368.1 ABC transporter substrate-binding protein [Aerococcus sp. YH-aer221]MCZ0725656.1 ABC transporter substrate-binding protein [Aerococcus sp. YH-aer222]
MNFKKILKGAAVLTTSAFLVACGNGGGQSNSGADGDKVEITFWHSMGGSTGEALDKIVQDYNESQDEVVVNAQYQREYDDALTKLRSSASGSNVGADIVQVFEQGTTFMKDSGLAVPVQEYIDETDFDTSVLEPNLLAYYTVDDTLYSMPFNSSTPIMYYNKDMFAEAGIDEAPTSLEEIKEIAPKLEDAGADMAMSLGVYGWYIEQFITKQEELMYDNNNGRDGQANSVVFDDNGSMEKTLGAWKDLQDEGVAPMVGREGGQPEFVSGSSAITVGSTANLRQILDEVDGRFEVGTAYFPGVTSDDQGGVSIGGASLWMIDSEDDARKDATWDFIQYLVSPDVQAQWNRDTGYFPVNTGAHDTDVFKQNIEEFPQFETAINQLHDSNPEDQGALTGVNQEARKIYEAELEKLLNDEQSVDEAVKNSVEQVNAALSNYQPAKAE